MQETTLITRANLVCKVGLAGLFAASCLTAPTWALAQQAADAPAAGATAPISSIAEIVVTARRHEEKAQAVPISIVSLNKTQLTQEGVVTANDLSRVAPGLSIMNTAASRSAVTFSIRGQGSTFGSGPGVIPYFADVANFSEAIFDIGNVQVLKGPQGTLFGRNTSGGAVLFEPQLPTEDYNGYIDTRLGNYGRRDFEFGVGGAVIPGNDMFTFRVSGQILNRDGYTTDTFDGAKLDNENKENFRGIFTFKPFESFDNTTIVQTTRQHENNDGAVLINVSPAIPPLYPALQGQLALQQSLGNRQVLGAFPLHKFVSDTTGVINTTSWRISDNFSLKNIASFLDTNGEKNWDLSETQLPLLGVLNPPNKNHQYTEEFQARGNVGPVSGAVGYYYERITAPFQMGFVEVSPILFAPFAPANAEVVGEGSSSVSRGPYAQLDWKATSKLTLTGGARYTTDELTAEPTGSTLTVYPPTPILSTLAFQFAPGQRHTFNTLTWNFAADYAVDQNMNAYGHVAKGYKQGGFNGTAPPGLQEYLPEYVTDYELGVKGRFNMGGWQTTYDIDGFYDDYTNIQRDENVGLPSGAVATVIQNAAAGHIDGAEFQLTVVPNRYIRVTAGYTYLDAKYSAFDGGVGVGDVSRSRFPNTPANQLTVTPLVTIPIPENIGTLTAQANIYYQSSYATDAFNVRNGNSSVDLDAAGANAPGYTRVDLRADWRHIFGTQISVALYGQNVFNEKYIVGTDNQLNTFGVETALFNPPPFYGVELRWEFGK